MKLKLVLVCALAAAPCWAQTEAVPATPAAPATPAPARAEPGEPNVKHTVIEDRGSKIDELRVRGQLQRVVVTPKVGVTKPYEIVISPSGRDPFDGTGGAHSAAGNRVWNVLNF